MMRSLDKYNYQGSLMLELELLAEMEPENPDKPQRPKEEKPRAATDAQAIKTKTERDLYKKFSEELLEILKGGPRE